MATSIRLSLFKSLWGAVSQDGGKRSAVSVLKGLRQAGYTGVECSVKLAYAIAAQDPGFVSVFNDEELEWIPIAFSSGPVCGWHPLLEGQACPSHDAPPPQHAAALSQQIRDALRLGIQRIAFINCHTGHDSFGPQQAAEVVGLANELQHSQGHAIVHEIHRGRVFHSPYTTLPTLQALPETRVVADYSHFLAACETVPGDEVFEAALKAIRPHVSHVHARVGYENGPQVTDPRSAEWQPYTDAHFGWWRDIWGHQAAVPGAIRSTLTPETGPPSYQHTAPGGKPLADIDQVNEWLGSRARREFESMRL